MGEFKDMLKARSRTESYKKEHNTINQAIEERGKKTIKIPNYSDKKTGGMMIERKNLSKRIRRVGKLYRGRRNKLVAKTGGKALLLGGALYGGKVLLDSYDKSQEKYAGYVSRVADSLSRSANFGRGIGEMKLSVQKAGKLIKKELSKKKPSKGELGHLNARKVKDTIRQKKKKNMKRVGQVAGPLAAVGTGVYLKKEYDQSHPARLTSYYR